MRSGAPTPDSLSIYLPNPESELSRRVIKGSAIVGLAQPDGRILIHYEGNRLSVPELRFRVQRPSSRGGSTNATLRTWG